LEGDGKDPPQSPPGQDGGASPSRSGPPGHRRQFEVAGYRVTQWVRRRLNPKVDAIQHCGSYRFEDAGIVYCAAGLFSNGAISVVVYKHLAHDHFTEYPLVNSGAYEPCQQEPLRLRSMARHYPTHLLIYLGRFTAPRRVQRAAERGRDPSLLRGDR